MKMQTNKSHKLVFHIRNDGDKEGNDKIPIRKIFLKYIINIIWKRNIAFGS